MGKIKIKTLKNKLMEKYPQPQSESPTNEVTEEQTSLDSSSEENYRDDYISQGETREVSFIEMAIINDYLHDCYRGKNKEIVIDSYGFTDSLGKITFGSVFEVTGAFWFKGNLPNYGEIILQTKTYVDASGCLVNILHTTSNKGLGAIEYDDLFKEIKSLSFNNSRFKGKCIKVKLREGRFRGIEIINIEESANELILNDVQKRYIKHFINRLNRGGNARYLLNGEPGTGKTETIREIGRHLIPNVTFVIPDFTTQDDLTSIMEACEIFDRSVIVMDDIDLYLGSRDNGSYTRLLGQFLSFFDGVKKRNISLLASTNDKGLVDKAAERPGRFNFTLDYGFLDDSQIIKVCKIHLPKKWQVKEVYEALTERINGKDVNITGAFIANLADNIKEMSEDDKKWSVKDTISLIKESYKGFYSSQVEKENKGVGFML